MSFFPTDYDYIEKVVSNLCHSPYPINVVKRVCYKWYNSIKHVNGDRTKRYINYYYKYEKSNKWFYSIINNYYRPRTMRDEGWTDEDERLYNKLAFKPNNELTYKQRIQKESIKTKYFNICNKLKNSLTKYEREEYENRKHFVKLFNDIKRIITPYDSNGSYYNRLFVDKKKNVYMLNEYNKLEQINKEKFNTIIRNHNINEKKLTIIDSIEQFNYIRKYNDMFKYDDAKKRYFKRF